jgi:hypothetical protein
LLIAAEALQAIETVTTIRVRNGKLSVTDGPFAETKEQLAGFYDRGDGLERSDSDRVEDPASS